MHSDPDRLPRVKHEKNLYSLYLYKKTVENTYQLTFIADVFILPFMGYLMQAFVLLLFSSFSTLFSDTLSCMSLNSLQLARKSTCKYAASIPHSSQLLGYTNHDKRKPTTVFPCHGNGHTTPPRCPSIGVTESAHKTRTDHQQKRHQDSVYIKDKKLNMQAKHQKAYLSPAA